MSTVLKPEGTMPIINYFVSSGLDRLQCFYIERTFRYERPQSGRYREFTQLGCEHISFSNEQQHINALLLTCSFLDEIKMPYEIQINIVDKNNTDIENYVKDLLSIHRNEFDVKTKDKINSGIDIYNILDRLSSREVEIIKKYFNYENCFSDIHMNQFKDLLVCMKIKKIRYSINPSIVRGITYYDGIVWEIKGEHHTIGGGGNYGRFISDFHGKRKIYATGFALGLDRMVKNYKCGKKISDKVFIKDISQLMKSNTKNFILIDKIKNKKKYG